MKKEKHTHEDLRQAEVDTLARTLGAVGAVKFLQQLEKGTGSQTSDKMQWQAKSHAPTLTHKSKSRLRKQP